MLVYLGGRTFCDTKLKTTKCFRQLPTPNSPRRHEEPDSDFVYDPELPWGSPVPRRHTRSMGTPPPDNEPVDEPVDVDEPPDMKPKKPKWK